MKLISSWAQIWVSEASDWTSLRLFLTVDTGDLNTNSFEWLFFPNIIQFPLLRKVVSLLGYRWHFPTTLIPFDWVSDAHASLPKVPLWIFWKKISRAHHLPLFFVFTSLSSWNDNIHVGSWRNPENEGHPEWPPNVNDDCLSPKSHISQEPEFWKILRAK